MTTFAAEADDHIAKDVILAGVKSVTVYDPEPVAIADLSSQVRLTSYLAAHKGRADASI